MVSNNVESYGYIFDKNIMIFICKYVFIKYIYVRGLLPYKKFKFKELLFLSVRWGDEFVGVAIFTVCFI